MQAAPAGSIVVVESDERFDFSLLPTGEVGVPGMCDRMPPAVVGVWRKLPTALTSICHRYSRWSRDRACFSRVAVPARCCRVIAVLRDRRASAAEPAQEILLWPADHPANAGNEPAFAGTVEWMERVTRSPAITPFLPEPHKRTARRS